MLLLRNPKEAHRRQEELHRALMFLDSIVENVPHMIFVKDAEELRFELFNRAGEELLGIPRRCRCSKATDERTGRPVKASMQAFVPRRDTSGQRLAFLVVGLRRTLQRLALPSARDPLEVAGGQPDSTSRATSSPRDRQAARLRLDAHLPRHGFGQAEVELRHRVSSDAVRRAASGK